MLKNESIRKTLCFFIEIITLCIIFLPFYEIWIIFGIAFTIVFILSIILYKKLNPFLNEVFTKMSGILLFLFTPIVDYTWIWAIIGLLIFHTFLKIDIIKTIHIKSERLTYIMPEILSGLITNFLMNLFYMAWKILPMAFELLQSRH